MRHKLTIDEAKIDRIFEVFDQNRLPGVAVGVAVGGEPVYRKGFGLANMELPVVLSPTTRMRIGSTTKQFAAFAYMLLCEEGKASADDCVGRHIPELHSVMRGITMRQLMGNMGGNRDVHDLCWQFSGTGRPVTCEELLRLYRNIDDLNFPAGSTFLYNNGGWLMLSVVIERITGEPLEDVLRKRVFVPIGMNDSLLRRWDTDFVSNSAALHMISSADRYDEWYENRALGTLSSADGFRKSYLGTALTGEGGIVSTVDDMLRWLAHMDKPTVGNAATWAAMRTVQRVMNGTSTGYCLGLIRDSYRGVERIHHSGGVLGGNAQMLKVPSADLDTVVITNRSDVFATTLADQVIDACLIHLDPVMTGPDAILEGLFRSAVTDRVIQLFARNGQQFAGIDGTDMRLYRSKNGLLWPEGKVFGCADGSVALSIAGDPQTLSSLQLNHFGNLDDLAPLQDGSVPNVDDVVGHYRSDSADIDILIDVAKGQPRLHTSGPFGSMDFRLENLAKGIWRARPTDAVFPPGGILTFNEDGGGFRFSSFRTWRLPFFRVLGQGREAHEMRRR